MLIGGFRCVIDVKGRLNFPAKLRGDLGGTFIITKALGERCIDVYSLEEWKKKSEKISALPMKKARELGRVFFANATEAEPDKQGRIVIPQELREYAHLDKEVRVVGVSDHCEIWDLAAWQSLYQEEDSPEEISALLEELDL
ncbi:MAG TPA: division/cell wall cluster transcriptional repressor MraZ [Candidatus Egerieicola faecale]|uniref:Transcriptional regulator MraZ n=1 Tax=Candidatus Egerieicola faecale TaxID=2840774 RepID=A0A9D1IPH5_9FIRM|nr:division/cell wall cluster transcriptional repressor MraZ [Candidatus Egerieicola faecale]